MTLRWSRPLSAWSPRWLICTYAFWGCPRGTLYFRVPSVTPFTDPWSPMIKSFPRQRACLASGAQLSSTRTRSAVSRVKTRPEMCMSRLGGESAAADAGSASATSSPIVPVAVVTRPRLTPTLEPPPTVERLRALSRERHLQRACGPAIERRDRHRRVLRLGLLQATAIPRLGVEQGGKHQHQQPREQRQGGRQQATPFTRPALVCRACCGG